jgi:ATP-dependent Clp protease ATP-binding subunit ClpA
LPFTALERAVIAELRRFFRPELIGRFDERIVFKPLSPEVQREIGSIAIWEELDRFNDRGFNLAISEEAFEFLIRRGSWRLKFSKRKSRQKLVEACS